ncbi:glycosyltransferase [Curtobacterium flaccumfaciens]|uniref:glycosyltransferase n=1 Tax=Curtobacterium flaccumfaciens TaxID=2035 RepID=UPI003F7D5D0E
MSKNNERRAVAIVGTRGYPSYYGGFETAVRRLAPFLVEAGWDVTVYGRPGTTVDDDPDRDERVRTATTRGIESKSLSTLTYGLSAALHVARRRPAVALVMNVANGFWLPVYRLAGVRTVVNVDGMEWERAKWNRVAKAVFKLGAKLTARWADELVVDAEEIGRRWEAQFGRGGTFIPYGGDPAGPLPIEPGLEHREYVLMVARFVPENTVHEFLEAAEQLADHHDVVIVGSTGYGGELDEKAADLATRKPRVRWLGHVSDDRRLFSLWQHAGVYFHGHSVGGTNPALVQAMMLGAPTVARDTPFNREALAGHARFVQPTPAAIVSTVRGLLSDREDQEASSEQLIRRAVERYGWDEVCATYEALLRGARVEPPERVSTANNV